MSLVLPSLGAAPSVQPSARPAERGSDPETPVAGSFGEALSRASQTADEPAAKPQDKATATPTARRPGGPRNDTEEPAEPAPVSGLVLMALDDRSTPPALGSAAAAALSGAAAAALVGEARRPAAANPPAQALVSASLPAADAAPLPDAVTAVTIPAEPAGVMALAAPGARERGQSLLITRKDTTLPVAASDTAQTTVPRMALNAATTESPALRSPELPTAVAPEQKAAPGTIAVLPAPVPGVARPAGNETQPRLEALIASLSASGFAEPASGAEAGSVAGPTMMGPATQGPANIGGPVLPPTVLAPSLPQDVGSSEWGKALGQQLLHMGRADQKTAELQLNPPGLGPLKVTLSMNEHQIQVAFVSAHASVRAAVEAALPQLRAAMADGGISLGEASVGSESRQPADAGYGQEGRSGQRSYPGSGGGELAGSPERAAVEPRRQGSGTSVDIYA